jgi:hypothetical protein
MTIGTKEYLVSDNALWANSIQVDAANQRVDKNQPVQGHITLPGPLDSNY